MPPSTAGGTPATTVERRAGFISGCVMSVLFGATNASSVRLLNRAGYDVVTPPEQGCCGALYAHSGQLELARDCARHNIAVFERHNLSTIVINAAGCGSTLKEYGKLLGDDPLWADRARRFSASVKDLTEILVQSASSENSALRIPHSALKTTYHDACHLAHPQHITKQPRELIRSLVGGNFVELPESDVCCGSAGSYNLTEPAMAERLQQRKIENILKTGAQVVVTTNPGCLLQIRVGLRKAGSKIEALHIADFLDPASRTIKVRGWIDNSQRLLKAEMLVTAELETDEPLALQVPTKAVFLRGDRHCLFIEQAPGTYERHEVKIGAEHAGKIQVLSGLQANQRIVTDASLLLEQLMRESGS